MSRGTDDFIIRSLLWWLVKGTQWQMVLMFHLQTTNYKLEKM